MYEAILFIVFHRAIFKYHVRKNIRATFEKRFHVLEKQRANLNKWPALQSRTRVAWSNLNMTTNDNFAHGLDFDDS